MKNNNNSISRNNKNSNVPQSGLFWIFFSTSKKGSDFVLFLTAHLLRPKISILFPSFSVFLLGYEQSRLVCGIVFVMLTAANLCAFRSRSNSVVCLLLGLKQNFLERCHLIQNSYWFLGWWNTRFQARDCGAIFVVGRV